MVLLKTSKMAASIITLDQIPSLTSLYHDGKLKAGRHPAVTTPSASANNRAALIQSDITLLQTDAIVNAANELLLGGAGVDGAIHKAAGPRLLDECRSHHGCPAGEARITRGYNLPAAYVIHTTGPVYSSDEKSEPVLTNCYRRTLELAAKRGLRSVAFVGISSGVYGYPGIKAATVACRTVREYLDKKEGPLEKVVFVTFLQKEVEAYNEIIPMFFPPVEEETDKTTDKTTE